MQFSFNKSKNNIWRSCNINLTKYSIWNTWQYEITPTIEISPSRSRSPLPLLPLDPKSSESRFNSRRNEGNRLKKKENKGTTKRERGDDRRNSEIYWPKMSCTFADVNPQKLLPIFFFLCFFLFPLLTRCSVAARWPPRQIKKIKIKRKSEAARRMYEVAG